ncbi:hypothetical protein JCM19275_1262 [Nonlabens ulvanivorans]|uniref:Uncharacterized protein n=1 Tax=Nonlabens ulvanivorans TaxID=906888 RepID=A0A090WK13_NONUL|nr:hypothetical protein [Nonlabens ulvanivorans]GAL76518.1 hypothetical protein JCM19275_1262 [Nonlabens ulvanivorans]
MRFKGFLWLCIAAFTTNSALAMIQEPTDATRITDHHINYTIDQDSNYIFLNISTTHKETTLSILRHGLTVYFDETGDKERNVFVRYPYHNTPQRPNRSSRPQTNTDETPSIDYQEIIANIPGEAEYAFYGDQQEFHKDLNAFDISLGYQMTGEEQDTLEYSIKIPKNRITQDDKLDLSKLTIGIFTNMPEKNKDRESPSDTGVSMRGGNQRGGGRGGSGGGRGNRGERPSSQKEPTRIDYWFNAGLE